MSTFGLYGLAYLKRITGYSQLQRAKVVLETINVGLFGLNLPSHSHYRSVLLVDVVSETGTRRTSGLLWCWRQSNG